MADFTFNNSYGNLTNRNYPSFGNKQEDEVLEQTAVEKPQPSTTVQQPAENTKSFHVNEEGKEAGTGIEERQRVVNEQKKLFSDTYGIVLTPAQSELFTKAITNEIKEKGAAAGIDLSYRYAAAIKYSQLFNITPEEAFDNLDEYNNTYWADPVDSKGALKAIGDNFALGKNTLRAADIGNRLSRAEYLGDTKSADLLLKEYESLQKENELLQDVKTRNFFVESLKAAANTLPYSAAVAIPSMLTSVVGLGPLGEVVGYKLTYGLEYLDLRAAGANADTASVVASLSSGAQTLVETVLGDIASAGVVAAGNKTGVTKIANKLVTRLGLKGVWKKLAAAPFEVIGGALSEGAEEFIQELCSQAGYELAAILQEEGVAVGSWADSFAEGWEEAKGAFIGSLILGPTGKAVGYGINKAFTAKEASDIKKDAVTIDSKAAFIDKQKKSIAAGDIHLFEGYSDEEITESLAEIYDNQETEREKDVAESTYLGDDAEQFEQDETGENLQKGTEYRQTSGELYTEYSDAEQNKDGSITQRFLVGDNTRPHANEEYGNVYGEIKFTEKDGKVTITDFKMTPGRENLAYEFYEKFAESKRTSDIIWKPQHETNIKLKKSLMTMNPAGRKSGLNYFKDIDNETFENRKSYLRAAENLKEVFTNWNDVQITSGLVYLNALAAAQIKKGNVKNFGEFLDSWFQNGQVVTNKASESIKKHSKNGYVYGAANFKDDFGKDVKAIIYVSEKADFNTWVHELAHVARKHLDQNELAEAERLLNVQDGKWTTTHEEAFADLMVNYLRNGKTNNDKLKPIVEIVSDFIARIWRGLQRTLPNINPALQNVFDSLLSDDSTGIAMAMNAVEEASWKGARRRQYEVEQGARKERTVTEQDAVTAAERAAEEQERLERQMLKDEIAETLSDEGIYDFDDFMGADPAVLNDIISSLSEETVNDPNATDAEKASLSLKSESYESEEAEDPGIDIFQQTLFQSDYLSFRKIADFKDDPKWLERVNKAKTLLADTKLYPAEEAKRINDNLKANKNTPWYHMAIESILTREEIRKAINGEEIEEGSLFYHHFDEKIDKKTGETKLVERGNPKVLAALRKGMDGVWEYLGSTGFLANPAKPVLAVNASMLNCNPSKNCARYCYVADENSKYTMEASLIKSELVDLAINTNPELAAKYVAAEYQHTTSKDVKEALRIFDKGDINQKYVDFINALNDRNIAVQVFTKRPEFLSQIDLQANVAMLSIDNSNEALADLYPDLPVAYVYTGKADADFIIRNKDRFIEHGGCILPITEKNKVPDLSEVPQWAVSKYTCPINSGKIKKIGTGLNEWNCRMCDAYGSAGCFYGKGIKNRPSPRREVFEIKKGDVNGIFTAITELYNQGRLHTGESGFRDSMDLLRDTIMASLDSRGKIPSAEELAARMSEAQGISGENSSVERGNAEEGHTLYQVIPYKAINESPNNELKNKLLEIKHKAEEQYNSVYDPTTQNNERANQITKRLTGFEKGSDNEWYYETDDSSYVWNQSGYTLFTKLKQLNNNQLEQFNHQYQYTVKNFLMESEITNLFPKLKDLRVLFKNDPSAASRSYISHDGIVINLAKVNKYGENAKNEPNVKLSLLLALQNIVLALNNDQAQVELRTATAFEDIWKAFINDTNPSAKLFFDEWRKWEGTTRAKFFTEKTAERFLMNRSQRNISSLFKENTFYQIVGKKGVSNLDAAEEVTTRMNNMAVAKQMETSGKDPKSILLATGWQKGADGEWKYEINDGRMKDFNKVRLLTDTSSQKIMHLEDIYDAPELYKAYPSLKKMMVSFDKIIGEGHLGEYSNEGDFIRFPFKDFETLLEDTEYIEDDETGEESTELGYTYEKVRSTLIHEIQHAIQYREGFGTGSNPKLEWMLGKFDFNSARRSIRKKLENYNLNEAELGVLASYAISPYDFDDDTLIKQIVEKHNISENDQYKMFDQFSIAYEKYMAASGEVEARNAAARRYRTIEERLQSLLEDTEDLPRDEQIVSRAVILQMANIERESQANVIKDLYKDSPDYMKAPNGKDTNLTEQQWLEVRTENFKKWFGDWENDPENSSKVLDENGEPLVVYHGTKRGIFSKKFDVFRTNSPAWFSINKNYAKNYTDAEWSGEVASMYDTYLNIKKPFMAGYLDWGENGFNLYSKQLNIPAEDLRKLNIPDTSYLWQITNAPSFKNYLESKGYDGIFASESEDIKTYGVFNSNQIKSAKKNNGDFSVDNNSILFQVDPTSENYMKAPNGENTNLTEQQWNEVRSPAFKKWFGDWENDPENSSKVLDKNGEPLVVYHGSIYDFDTFDFKKLGSNSLQDTAKKGFFFVSNPAVAEVYGTFDEWDTEEILKTKTAQNLIKKAKELATPEEKAKLENLINNNAPWKHWSGAVAQIENEISRIFFKHDKEEDRKSFRKFRELSKYKKQRQNLYPSFLNIRNPSTDLDEAIKGDGLIVNDIVYNTSLAANDPGKNFRTNMYIVSDGPNQIKSAVSNNGDFSTVNNSILYQTSRMEEVEAEPFDFDVDKIDGIDYFTAWDIAQPQMEASQNVYRKLFETAGFEGLHTQVGDRQIFVHKNTRSPEENKWQISYFDKFGPWADSKFNTFEELLQKSPGLQLEAKKIDVAWNDKVKYDVPYFDALQKNDMDEAQRLATEYAQIYGITDPVDTVVTDSDDLTISLTKRFDEKRRYVTQADYNNPDETMLFQTGPIDEADKQYITAVENGDMETVEKLINERLEKAIGDFHLLQDDAAETGWKYHRGPAPKVIRNMYAVFNVSEDGFRAAYAGNKNPTPVGIWIDAQSLQSYVSDKVTFKDGTYKSYIRGDTGSSASTFFSPELLKKYGLTPSAKMLLQRSGKHGSDIPNFGQMNLGVDENGNKIVNKITDGALPHNKLIFEIECGMAEDGDLTEYVKDNGRMDSKGNEGLSEIGPNQFYFFKTNPNANGNWGIAGTFRIKRLVPYEEIVSKTQEANEQIAKQNEIIRKENEGKKKKDQQKLIDPIPLQKWVGGYHPEHLGLTVQLVDQMYEEGKKGKLRDLITYDDEGNIIPPSQRFNEKIENLLYQDENPIADGPDIRQQIDSEIFGLAKKADTWQEFKDSIEVLSFLNKDIVPSDVDDEFFKNIFEKAHAAEQSQEYTDENKAKSIGEIQQQESEKDQDFYNMIQQEGQLENFMLNVGIIINENFKDFTPSDQEEAAWAAKVARQQDRIYNELRDYTFRGRASRIARDKAKGSESIFMQDSERKKIMTMIKNNKRDWRDMYADFMDDPQWKVAEGESTRDNVRVKLAAKKSDIDQLSVTQIAQLAERIDFEELRDGLKDGTMEMNMDNLQQLINGYDKEILGLKKRYENLMKEKQTDSELAVKQQAALEKLNAQIVEKQRLKEQLDDIRQIKIRLIKEVNKRVDFKKINYVEGRKIIAIQAIFQPLLKKFVNNFLNSEGTYLREAYSKYKTDFAYRTRLQSIADSVNSISVRRVINLFELKPYDKWTEDDRTLVAANLPATDWIEELDLDYLMKKREETLQLDLQSPEVKMLLAETLPENVYALIEKKPLKTWTLEQMEDLTAVVNELREKGKEVFKVKEELRRQRADNYRAAIEKTLKSPGVIINDDDDDETKKRKQAAIDKFRNKELPKILGTGNPIAGTLEASDKKKHFFNKLLHGYSDANIRRVARILDNGTEGINTTLLYYRENECYNNEQNAIVKRQRKIERYMRQNKIALDELFKKVEIDFGGGEKHSFTIDEILYFEAAAADPKSERAVACGNMFDETVKRNYRGSKELQEQYEKMALARLKIVRDEVEKLDPKFRGLMAVIQQDYTDQFERMNKCSAEEFNQLVNRVKAYVPLIRLEANGDTNVNKVKQDMLGSAAGIGTAGNWVEKGFTKNRIEISPANQKPVVTGLYSTWADSLKRTEHFIAYAGYVRELNRVYMNRDSGTMKAYMTNRYGEGMYNYIDAYIKELANPDVSSAASKFDQIVHMFRGKTAPAYLAWKMSGIIKQACTSPWPYMQYVSPVKYAAAALKFAKNPADMTLAVKSKSAYMNSRRFDPIVDLINEQKKKATNKYSAALTNFENLGMQGLEWIDWACVAPGWYAVYAEEYARLNSDDYQNKLVEAKRKKVYEDYGDAVDSDTLDGMAEAARMSTEEIEKAAVLKADDITRMCQPSNRLTDLSPMYKERGKGSELQRALLQFTTSLNVIWQNLWYDIPAAAKNGQMYQIVGAVAGYVLAGITVGLVTQGLNRNVGDDDDEEMKAIKRTLNMFYYASTQFTDAVPIMGSTLTSITDSITSGKFNYSSTSDMFPVVTKSLKGAGSTMKAVSEMTSGEKEKALAEWKRAVENWGYAAGLTLGLPVSGIKEAAAVVGVGDHEDGLDFYPQALIGRRK